MDRLELAQKEAELLEADIPYAAVTLVESAGTARTEGKMLVLSADTIFGTIGRAERGNSWPAGMPSPCWQRAITPSAIMNWIPRFPPKVRPAADPLPSLSKAAAAPVPSSLWSGAAMWACPSAGGPAGGLCHHPAGYQR